MADPADPQTRPLPVGRLFFLMIVRIVFNTFHRMVYPFLPEFARFFEVTPGVFSAALGFRSLAGVASPFLSRFADSRGRRFGMLLGAGFFVAGLGLVIAWPSFETFILGLALGAFGKYTFDPSVQAYVSDEIPVARRGAAIAIIELGWSLSYFIGVSGLRVLIERFGGLAPFQVLLFFGLAAFGSLFVLLPRDRPNNIVRRPFWPAARSILSSQNARLGLLVGLLLSSANELVSLTFARWLEDSFQARLAALALAAVVIGVSELLGESLVGLLTDRLGSRRAVAAGALLNTFFAVLLPVLAAWGVGTSLGLFLFYLSFEFTIVSSFPMMTEIPTDSRATLLGINLGVLSLGRMAAAWLAPLLYLAGFTVVIGAVVLLNLAGWVSVRALRIEPLAVPADVPFLDPH